MPLSAGSGGAAKRATWLAAAVASLSLICAPAAAQDMPWGKSTKSTPKKKPAKKPSKQPSKKAAAGPANKPAAVKKPANNAPKAAATKAKPTKAAPVVVTPQQATDLIVDEIARRTRANPFPGAAPPPAAQSTRPTPRHIDDPLGSLHQALSRYGLWVDHAEHGTVWIPDPAQVGSHFAPYRSAGRWAVDERANWSWVSDYPWGEVPFHFGNWTWIDAQQGWAWVPGTEAAPAWVVWRLAEPGRDFVGWAPTPPTHRWVDGSREALPAGSRTLAFSYLRTRDLFAPEAAARLVRDQASLGEMHEHSATFAGNLSQCMSPGQELRPQQKCAASPPWLTATPSFAAAGVPLDAIPLTRLSAPRRSFSRAVQRLIHGPEHGSDSGAERPHSHRPEALETPPQARRRKPVSDRMMRRCVQTRSHGLKCWRYRWPPLWRGRR